MSDARARILGRLKAAPRRPVPERPAWTPPTYPDKAARFRAMLEASHAEVYDARPADWPERLLAILANRGLNRVLYAPATDAGRALAEAWSKAERAPPLVPYDRPVEDLKPALVGDIDAAITSTLGGIAETGSLVLWPSADEPRLMSLLPPLHIALVEEARLADNFADLVRDEGWAGRMPTNALLISGPSKTADIEQTLAYGVHGPKELIVILIRQG